MVESHNLVCCVLAAVFFLYTSNLSQQIDGGVRRTGDIWVSDEHDEVH